MIVIDERNCTQAYETLKFGDVFLLGDRYYIKTNILMYEDDVEVYAVDLATGQRHVVNMTTSVKPVNCKLVIDR